MNNTQRTSASGGSDKNLKAIGEEAWKRADKINADLLSMTYGTFVAQVLRDSDTAEAANATLDRLGYSLGIRLIDDFLARNAPSLGRCSDFREVGEVMAKVAFKQFLNFVPAVLSTNGGGNNEFVLQWSVTEGDGLGSELVELPEVAIRGGLHYHQMLCGVIRGALEMINYQVECSIQHDPLLAAGNPVANPNVELLVKLIRIIDETAPPLED